MQDTANTVNITCPEDIASSITGRKYPNLSKKLIGVEISNQFGKTIGKVNKVIDSNGAISLVMESPKIISIPDHRYIHNTIMNSIHTTHPVVSICRQETDTTDTPNNTDNTFNLFGSLGSLESPQFDFSIKTLNQLKKIEEDKFKSVMKELEPFHDILDKAKRRSYGNNILRICSAEYFIEAYLDILSPYPNWFNDLPVYKTSIKYPGASLLIEAKLENIKLTRNQFKKYIGLE